MPRVASEELAPAAARRVDYSLPIDLARSLTAAVSSRIPPIMAAGRCEVTIPSSFTSGEYYERMGNFDLRAQFLDIRR